MSARATTLAVALWLVLTALLLFLAFNAGHFSPWEFLIPHAEPLSWIVPTVVAGPPLLLAVARRAGPELGTRLAWGLAAVLAALLAALLLFLSPSAFPGR